MACISEIPSPSQGNRSAFITTATTETVHQRPDHEYRPIHDKENRHVRVFLMQNHPLMILGTTSFLNGHDFVVSGSATTPASARNMLDEAQPEVVVFELSINGPYDFPFLKRLRRAYPSLPILAYAYHEEVVFARRALEAGANGYLMKEAHPGKLTEAIRQVLAGGVYTSERVKARIAREQKGVAEGRIEQLNGMLVNSLTIRELQIFQFIGDGCSTARIERELQLTPEALKSACYRIRRKLGLNNAADLLQFAFHWAYYEGDFS